MVQALTKHTIVGDQYTACPGNRFPFDEIFKACAMALRPSQIVFMLDNPTVGERMSHLPQNNRVTLSQAPFISDDSAYIQAKDAKKFGLIVPKEYININGYVRLRTLADLYDYNTTWIESTRTITFRRKDGF
jgi:hypothetical protein